MSISKDQNLNLLNVNKINTNSLTIGAEYTNLKLPAFLSYMSVSASKVIGNNGEYRIGSSGSLTNLFSIGTQINSSGLFTCLYSGVYNFGVNITVAGVVASRNIFVYFVVEENNIILQKYLMIVPCTAGVYNTLSTNTLIKLNTGQNVYTEITAFDEASNVIGVAGLQTPIITSFYGNLL